jgi:NAD-dependent SIR2 family protein deacetylase
MPNYFALPKCPKCKKSGFKISNEIFWAADSNEMLICFECPNCGFVAPMNEFYNDMLPVKKIEGNSDDR